MLAMVQSCRSYDWKKIASRRVFIKMLTVQSILLLLLLSTTPSGGQKSEASEMPEDCAADQYFNLAESRCENCSDALRVFESAIGSYQDWQQPMNSNNNNNNEARPPPSAPAQPSIDSSNSSSGKKDDQKAAHLARLGQRLPQLGSSNSVSKAKQGLAPSSSAPVTSLGAGPAQSTSTGGGTRLRPTTVGVPQNAANAILSRLVMKSSSSQAGGGVRESNGEEQTGPEPGVGGNSLIDDRLDLDSELGESGDNLLPLGDLSSGQQQQQQPQQMGRPARHWLRLLGRFLQSQELHQLNILESIRQCRQNLNTTSCQMWSNLCVLTMYAHTSDNPTRRFPSSNASPAAHLDLRQQQQQQHPRRPPPTGAGSDQDHANLDGGASFRTSWQKCPKFSLASVCNSLRDWHQYDKQQVQLDVANIYAEDETIGVGGSGADQVTSAKIGGRSLKLNEPIQLLAYKYALDGQLVEVSQFGAADMGQFCVTSSASASTLNIRQARARLQDNLNLFLDTNYIQQLSGDGEGGDLSELVGKQLKVGQNLHMSCKFSSLQANLFASNQLNETVFVDLFVAHLSPSGAMSIKPVPVLIKNLLYNSVPINTRYAHDPSRWKLVNRFFHHATLKLETRPPWARNGQADSAVPAAEQLETTFVTTGYEDEALVYAKSATFELNFRRDLNDKSLVINSILLQLEYDYVSLVRSKLKQALLIPGFAINESSAVGGGGGSGEQVNFGDSVARMSLVKAMHESEVKLSQNLADMTIVKKDFDLFLTIACLISCIWTLIKCYNVQKYQGTIRLDIYSLFLFIIIGCDIIANLIGLITLSFSLYLFISIKFHDRSLLLFGSGVPLNQQQQALFVPNQQLESALMVNLQLALVFKLIGLAYKFYVRLRCDLFFIDWERPKMLTSTQILHHHHANRSLNNNNNNNNSNTSSAKTLSGSNQQQQQQQQISFWRQYTVVNRWLQLQTVRRLNVTFQLILLATLIEYFELDRFATADASSSSSLSASHRMWSAASGGGGSGGLVPDYCTTFRAVIVAAVYVALASGQVLYKKCFHEPMIRSQVREFIDLCSVGNVSLFAMLYARFGFYIHGRNANGSSECGIGEMNALLEREERDLCSKRGLLLNTDQQTFVLVLPKIINDHYRKLLHSRAAIGDPTSYQNLPSPSATAAGLLGLNSAAQSGDESAKDISSLIKSSFNLSNSLSAASSTASGSMGGLHRHSQSLIEAIVARNRAINVFLINYLDHIYKDIDYEVRERKRFESLLLLDSDLDIGYNDDDLIGRSAIGGGGVGGARRVPPQTATKLSTGLAGGGGGGGSGVMGGIFSSIHQADANPAARGTFYVDSEDSFTTLLWLGLEWDLILFELLLLLNVDAWLGHTRFLATVSLIWLANKLTRALYSSWARSNLVIKSMLDEKFLIR